MASLGKIEVDYDEEFDPIQECVESEDPMRRKTSRSGSVHQRLRHKSGAASYADLITKAILSTREARLSLAEIYDWMATNVPGLQAQRYLHSSKGWKNAVRHTLSINPRFHKVVRMGRPSWWTVDADTVKAIIDDAHIPWKTSVTSLNEDNDEFEFELKTFRSRIGSEPAYYLSKFSKRPSVDHSDEANGSSYPVTKEGHFASCGGGGAVEMQQIKVWQNDGTLGLMTVQAPVHLKETVTQEMSTQTDDQQDVEMTYTPSALNESNIIPTPGYTNIIAPPCDMQQFPTFSTDLAPSLSDQPFQTLTTLDDWQQLPLPLEPLNDDLFTTNWFDNL